MTKAYLSAILITSTVVLLAFVGCYGSDYGGGPTPSGGTAPALTISSPTAGQTVAMSADQTIPVQFAVTNFTLKMPGTCGGDTACGHVHLKIDGDACNNTSTGKPYNASGFMSPITAALVWCPQPAGAHTLDLQLHHDDHSAVSDGAGGVVQTTVQITAQ